MDSHKIQDIGALGEAIACRFLSERGFRIREQNYRKKWGEIDIIAEKGTTLYFVEVKTERRKSGSRETFRPEEKVHSQKLKRLSRVTQTYLLEKGIEQEWKFLVISVILDTAERRAHIRMIYEVL